MNDNSNQFVNINPKKRNPTKVELAKFINESLKKINAINDEYKKLVEGTEDKPAIIGEINDKYEKIIAAYKHLFETDEQGVEKIKELNEKYEEIKNYHKELLTDPESIKVDIEDSKKHITDFFNYLFGEEENQGNEKKAKEAIEHIIGFDQKLTGDEGIKATVTKIYDELTKKYSELFEAEDNQETKVAKLEKNIAKIEDFDKKIDSEIQPKIDEKNKELEVLKNDIDKKSKDVSSLLASATGGALAEGYRESMEEYSKKGLRKYKNEVTKNQKWYEKLILLIDIFYSNNISRNLGQAIDHAFFIIPLILVCLILWNPDFINGLLGKPEKQTLSGIDFILYKAMLTFPLLWISWFGQQNISKRKRLFEEYNHKLRVSQMYILFVENKSRYTLKDTKELEKVLLSAIKNNPAKHLGKGATLIESMLRQFKLRGFYDQLKSEIITDVKEIVLPSGKNT